MVCEGWMVRYGRRKIGKSFFHMRYFVLETRLLAYYKRKPTDTTVSFFFFRLLCQLMLDFISSSYSLVLFGLDNVIVFFNAIIILLIRMVKGPFFHIFLLYLFRFRSRLLL